MKLYKKIIKRKMDSGPFQQNNFDDDPYHLHQKTSIHKTLILQSNCHPSAQYQVNIPYNYETRQLDLGRTLYQIFQSIIPAGHSYQVFYYCTQSQYYIFGGMYPFQDYLYIGENFIGQPVISIKIIRINPPQTQQPEIMNKKKRINDRTIRQVLEKVAQWRNTSKSKGITLEQSSKEVDLPKKTLDDYFFQIKQGQYYGFDFEAHQNDRVGILRKFVKENHKKKCEQPLKILQQFMEKSKQKGEQRENGEYGEYEQSNESEQQQQQQ